MSSKPDAHYAKISGDGEAVAFVIRDRRSLCAARPIDGSESALNLMETRHLFLQRDIPPAFSGEPVGPFYFLIPAIPYRYVQMGRLTRRGMILMRKLIAGVATTAVVCAMAYAPISAVAETAPDKAAVQKATAECKTQVKDYAKYNETSWYKRHKMVKKCVQDALAKK
jgi:hypothetical protein